MQKRGKIIIIVLFICLIGSLLFLLSEYNRYFITNNELISLQKELNETNDELNSVLLKKEELESEEQIISDEKKVQIKQYQKWLRQNQILKDLIK
jgi:cell division protein FtsL